MNAKPESGNTALIQAVDRGHPDVVRLLVEKGADLNAKNKDGMTALSLAESRGYEEVVRILKAAGAK